MNEAEKKVEMALTDNELDKVSGGMNPDVDMRYNFYVICDRGCGFRRGYYKSGDALDFVKAHKRCSRCHKGKLVIK